MKESLRQNHKKQATAKQLTSTIKDAVVPQLMIEITSLRAQIQKLEAELEQLKLSSVRTKAKRINYRNGIQTQ